MNFKILNTRGQKLKVYKYFASTELEVHHSQSICGIYLLNFWYTKLVDGLIIIHHEYQYHHQYHL